MLLVIGLFTWGQGEAGVITVDDDGSADHTSIQDAIDVAVEGDTILVYDGEYEEDLVIDKTINLVGNGSGSTTITGAGGGGGGDLVVITADWVSISGFEFRGNGLSPGFIRVTANNTLIENNHLDNNLGILIDNAMYNIVENNSISNNSGSGIFIKDSDFNSIGNNTISNCENGINLTDSHYNTITFNDCSRNTVGIALIYSSLCQLSNNSCSDNTEYGLMIRSYSISNVITGNEMKGNGVGISLDGGEPYTHRNLFMKNNITDNINGIEITNGSLNTFEKNSIIGNRIGILILSGPFETSIHHNNIHNNSQYGMESLLNDTLLPAIHNYWGDASGPYHPTSNPKGTGDAITDNLTFDPWIRSFIDFNDDEPPLPPSDPTFDPFIHFDPEQNITFCRRGENMTIKVQAPSIEDDPSIDHVVFQRCSSWSYQSYDGYNCYSWIDIGYDYNVSDSEYSIIWKATGGTNLFRVVAVDNVDNRAFNVSQYTVIKVVDTLIDLTVVDIEVSDETPLTVENVKITVTVHNEATDDPNASAENVKVRVFSFDELGNQEYLGELDYGSIDPNVDYNPDNPALGNGDKTASLIWTTPEVDYREIKNFTIKAQVDPDDWNGEINKTNNQNETSITVIGLQHPRPRILHVSHHVYYGEKITFSIICETDFETHFVEYRCNNTTDWMMTNFTYLRKNNLSGINSTILEHMHFYNYTSYWIANLSLSNYSYGFHSIEIRAFDGDYYSEPYVYFFKLEPAPEKENDYPNPFGLYILLGILGMLLSTLIILLILPKKPVEYLPPPTASSSSTTDDSSASPTSSEHPPTNGPASPTRHPPPSSTSTSSSSIPPESALSTASHCQYCGSPLPNEIEKRAIRVTCPECGEENVTERFR